MRNAVDPWPAVVRAVLLAALTAGVVVVASTPGWAHSELISTVPAADSTLTAAPHTVVLTFNDPIQERFSTVVVTGPGGASYANGPLRAIAANVSQDLFPLRSGNYHVAWRVVSADGHPISGEFGFTVRLPAQLEPTAGPPAPTSSGVAAPSLGQSGVTRSTWVISGVVVLGLVGFGVGAGLRRRRHTGDQDQHQSRGGTS